jgi:hypothetical protein
MDADDIRRGYAYHEAGHAIVASALGLRVTLVEIRADKEDSRMTVDRTGARLAICFAGRAAEKIFNARTHRFAHFEDWRKADTLVEHLDEPMRPAQKHAGCERAVELIQLHKAQTIQVAEYLMRHGKMEHDAGLALLPAVTD